MKAWSDTHARAVERVAARHVDVSTRTLAHHERLMNEHAAHAAKVHETRERLHATQRDFEERRRAVLNRAAAVPQLHTWI